MSRIRTPDGMGGSVCNKNSPRRLPEADWNNTDGVGEDYLLASMRRLSRVDLSTLLSVRALESALRAVSFALPGSVRSCCAAMTRSVRDVDSVALAGFIGSVISDSAFLLISAARSKFT